MNNYYYFNDLKSFINVAYVLTSLEINFEPSLKYLGDDYYEFCIYVLGDDEIVL